jgi:hypothetical protein
MLTTRLALASALTATLAAAAACFPSSSGGDVPSNGDGGSSNTDGGASATFSCTQVSDSVCTQELAPESAMAAEQQVCTNEMGTFAVGPCPTTGVVACCLEGVITQCYYSESVASIDMLACMPPNTWMVAGDGGADGGGSGVDVTRLAAGPGNAVAIAIDATNVYWATQADQNDDGTIMSVPIGGGAVITLATGQDPVGLAVDATTVYWTSNSQVLSVPIGGGTTTTLVQAVVNYTAIATGSGDVFFVGSSKVFKEPATGGTPTTLFMGTNSFAGIAVDSTNVYFSEFGTTDGVRKVPIAGGTATTISSYTGQPGAIAVDATNIYWLDATNHSISMAPLTGGTPVILASTDPNNVLPNSAVDGPSAIAVDAKYVYWTNAGNGSVMSVPIAGGTPTAIAESVEPSAIAVDATSVYFLSGLGDVDKLSPKPQ